MTAAVVSYNVIKRYRKSRSNAVDGISFEIASGQSVGVLGPNGAGKTTLTKLVCGVTPVTSGSLTVLGNDPADVRTRRGVSVVHQSQPFDMMLTALDNLRIAVSFRGLRWRTVRAHVDRLLDTFDLHDCIDRPVFTLSGGQRRRLQVVRALVRVPNLLVLDEPSSGMDVAGRRRVWQLVDGIRREYGTTVLWTSHNIDELERNCDRILVINAGRRVQFASPKFLVEEFGEKYTLVRPVNRGNCVKLLSLASQLGIDGRCEDGAARLTGPRLEERLPYLLLSLSENGIPVRSLEIEQTPLEDVFLDLVGGRSKRAGS